jgi:hypothetical protein
MFKGLNKIFWGFVLITFHINLGMFQMLPNFMGWGFIASGIYCLYHTYENEKFMISGRLAVVTAILSGVSLLFTLPNNGSDIVSPLLIAFTVLFSILELFVIFFLFDGYIDYLSAENNLELVSYFTSQLRYYIILLIIDIILECLVLTFQYNVLSIYVLGLAFILRLWLFILISHLKKLHQDEVEEVNFRG